MKTKTLGVLALAFLMFALFGCARSTAQPSSPTAITVSTTNSSLKTATLSPVATRTVTSQKTTIPAPTATSTPIPPTPIPAPLSQSGPWILLSQQQAISLNQPYPRAIMTAVFTNADGSAWEPVNLPPGLPELDAWTNMIDPNGPFIAFMNYLNSYPNQPTCDENDPLTNPEYMEFAYRLYILKLPENKVVQNTPLLGPQAIEEIKKENCQFTKHNRVETPPVFGVTKDIYNLSWSPDGRYLAYAAAPEGKGADIYLYDTDTDTTRRLSTRQNNPNILGWSLDSQIIIYRSVTKLDNNNLVIGSSGLYSVSITGTDKLLYKPKSVPNRLQWLSQSQFVITDGLCDVWQKGYCKIPLLLIDLTTGKSEVLYDDPRSWVIYYAADPIHHELLFTISTIPGVQRFDFEIRSIYTIDVENVPYLEWDANLEAFRYDDFIDLHAGPHTTLVRLKADKGFTVEEVDYLPNPSPDGNWKIVANEGNNFIQDAGGTNIQKLEKGVNCGWSPDSSTYVKLVQEPGDQPETQVMVYGKANNWQPIIARKITKGWDWSCEWITP